MATSYDKRSSHYFPSQSPRSLECISDRSTMLDRKASSSSTKSTLSSPSSTPKVQLVPYARTASFDISLSDAERELLDKANSNFDSLDLSSQDFDFEDIFTYDRPPQKKFTKGVVEVSRPNYRDWSSFSFSHYSAAVNARNKVNKARAGIGELYLKNKADAGKH